MANKNEKISLSEALRLYNTINPRLRGAPENWEFYFVDNGEAFRAGLIANAYVKPNENKQDDTVVVITFRIANPADASPQKIEKMHQHAIKFVTEVNKAAKEDGYDSVGAVIGFERSTGIARLISKKFDIIPIVFDRIPNSVYADADLVNRWVECFNRYPEQIPQSCVEQFINDKTDKWVRINSHTETKHSVRFFAKEPVANKAIEKTEPTPTIPTNAVR